MQFADENDLEHVNATLCCDYGPNAPQVVPQAFGYACAWRGLVVSSVHESPAAAARSIAWDRVAEGIATGRGTTIEVAPDKGQAAKAAPAKAAKAAPAPAEVDTIPE